MCLYVFVFKPTNHNLESGSESIQSGNGGSGSRSAGILVLSAGIDVSLFNGLEKGGGGFLLFGGGRKGSDGSAGLVHVTVEFSGDFEPGLLLDVLVKLGETLLGFRKNTLLSGQVFGTSRLVEGLVSLFTVDRVGRVSGLGLIRTVRSTFRVRGTVTDQTEDGKSGRFTDSGVGGGGEEGGTNGGSPSGDGFTTGGILLL